MAPEGLGETVGPALHHVTQGIRKTGDLDTHSGNYRTLVLSVNDNESCTYERYCQFDTKF